jgi:hypothetical protein
MAAPTQTFPDPDPPKRPGFIADLLQTRYREVTLSAVVFAIVIGIVMNAAITYAGLKIGFTIGGSAIAAVLGFGVLRGVLRRGSILETNIAQTIASAVNTSNSGVIFTVPVLFLIGFHLSVREVDFWLITLACVAGGLLGTAFIIPLRKQMLDIERLRFPSPTGVAMILKSPGAGPAKAVVLLLGIILGAVIYLPAGLPGIVTEADLDELDDLFARGKISARQAQETREIAGWIEAGSAPASVVDLGRALADGEIDAMPEGAIYSRELALAAHAAATGEAEWGSLRDRTLGWAPKPLFGYSDVNWRLPEEVDPAGETIDRNGDGEPDTPLTIRVDRNQDGRARALRPRGGVHHGAGGSVRPCRRHPRLLRAQPGRLLARVDARDGPRRPGAGLRLRGVQPAARHRPSPRRRAHGRAVLPARDQGSGEVDRGGEQDARRRRRARHEVARDRRHRGPPLPVPRRGPRRQQAGEPPVPGDGGGHRR